MSSPSSETPRRPPDNLPLELSSFVGREREVAEVRQLLGDNRLMTLTGPGGCGKTRLALAVASEVVEGFEDGVWWVALTPLSDPDLISQAVAQALGVREQPGSSLTQTLADALGEKRLLLVLDNCEHLIEACARFAYTMLSSCRHLRILATSREKLGVAGEVDWRVPSLTLPEVDHAPSVEDADHYEAIRLFVERARSKLSSFSLRAENAAAVAEVCRKLDGMPLAIELAAARVPMLSVEQISERLENPLELLSAGDRTAEPRQRTLRATLAWSHELLSEPERVVFRRLSVFAGGWTLEAAEVACAGEYIEREEVLDLLSRLVDKSLVVAGAGPKGVLRFRMLEPVRQYAYERLEESGEAEVVSRRHAEHYLALAEVAEPELKGAQQGEWLGRLEREHGNLRTALGWSIEGGDAELGLRLAGALERLWWARGYLSEGRRWLERGLVGSGAAPASARAKTLSEAGWIALWQDDLERAVELLEEGLGLFKELGAEPSIATSLTHLGHAVLHQEDKERLKALREEAEALREEFADQWAIAELLVFLGMAALYEGDHERAVTLLEESIASFRDLGDTQRVAVCVTYLWMAALEGGDLARAAALLEEDLRRLQRLEVQPQIQIYDDLMGSAVVAALGKRPARAARLRGAAEALRETIGLSLLLWDHTPTDHEAQLAVARSQLGEAAWEAAWSEGRAMTPEQAVEYALSTDDLPGTRPTTSYPAGLSTRETEVLKLVARGLTNAQIANVLFISPRTVDRHLNSVYRKLGISSRAAATRFAAEHNLL